MKLSRDLNSTDSECATADDDFNLQEDSREKVEGTGQFLMLRFLLFYFIDNALGIHEVKQMSKNA